MSPATIEIYFEHLSQFDTGMLVKAAEMAIDTCKFFPTIADIREQIKLLKQQSQRHKLGE